MSDILVSIDFSKDSKKAIKAFESNTSLSYKNWGEDCLKEVRKEIREYYRKIQGHKCSYCRQTVSITGALNAQIDHIIAKRHFEKFMFTPKNLCIICADCNSNKGEVLLSKNPKIKRYPKSSGSFLIYHPHFDKYENEILIQNECYYFGITPKGRKTIETCNLDRFAIVAHESSIEIFSMPDALNLASDLLKSTDALEQLKILNSLANVLKTKKS